MFVRVTMKRGSTSDIVAFSHILWIHPPPPYNNQLQEPSFTEPEDYGYSAEETDQSQETFSTYSSYPEY